MDTALKRGIEQLYGELPGVACRCCGQCCVSPTCTLVEFIYLLDRAAELAGTEQLATIFASPPQLHPDYDGNTRCPFLCEGRCAVHVGRTGACRLFGIPSLAHLQVEDMEQCRHEIDVTGGRSDIAFIEEWLARLVRLNVSLYPFGAPPYFLRGLNLHCWLDICFDELFDFDLFGDIRTLMHDNLDLSPLAPHYTPSTDLKEKIDKIGILTSVMGSGDRPSLRNLLTSIRDDYPLTGTFFFEEAQEMLGVVDSR